MLATGVPCGTSCSASLGPEMLVLMPTLPPSGERGEALKGLRTDWLFY